MDISLPELGHVMFTCTGSEANDLALRVAKAHTGGTGVIVTRNAYHGVTSALAEMSPSLGSSMILGDHVRTVPAPDAYRHDGDVGAAFADHVRQALADMRARNIKPAALLVDTIFSSDGVFADPAGFLQEAVAETRKAGALFIADEVQPGFGRTGGHMWGFQRHGLVPDIVTLGKPMGNGHPIGGMVARPEVLKEFGEGMRYFNTFGGNPFRPRSVWRFSTSSSAKVLWRMPRRIGGYLADGIKGLANVSPLIGDIRAAGLFIGVELVRDRGTREPAAEEAARVVNGLRARNVLISAAGMSANVLKIRPPLVFSKDNADLFLTTLADVLAEISGE